MWDQSWIWSLHCRSKTKNVSSFLTLVGFVVLHSLGFLSGVREAVPVEHISCLPCAPTDPYATHDSAPWITVSWSTTTLRALDPRTVTRKVISKAGVSSFTQSVIQDPKTLREKESRPNTYLPPQPEWLCLVSCNILEEASKGICFQNTEKFLRNQHVHVFLWPVPAIGFETKKPCGQELLMKIKYVYLDVFIYCNFSSKNSSTVLKSSVKV